MSLADDIREEIAKASKQIRKIPNLIGRARNRIAQRREERERLNDKRRQLDKVIGQLVVRQQAHIKETGERDHDLQDAIEQRRAERAQIRTRKEALTRAIKAGFERIANRGRRLRYWITKRNKLRKRLEYIQNHPPDSDGDGVVTFDGKPVAAWIVPWLQRSREAGWHGVVVSGYRTPEYSESLCYQMCGHPTCPGTCAGRASGHSQKVYPGGCVDVSDYYTFGYIQRQIGSPLHNYLPNDPVHYSVSGH